MRGFYLVRHGETEQPGRFLGQADPPLNAAGRRVARDLAEELAAFRPARLVSSGLRRARETAQAVGARCGLEPEADERLNEIGYGAWDGLSWAEIERRWPEQAAAKLADWWGVTPQGGEAADAFVARVRAAWEDLCADSRRPVIVVAHLGVNALLTELARADAGAVDLRRLTQFEQVLGEWIWR